MRDGEHPSCSNCCVCYDKKMVEIRHQKLGEESIPLTYYITNIGIYKIYNGKFAAIHYKTKSIFFHMLENKISNIEVSL